MALLKNITLSLVIHMLVLGALAMGVAGPFKQYMAAGERDNALWVEFSGEGRTGGGHKYDEALSDAPVIEERLAPSVETVKKVELKPEKSEKPVDRSAPEKTKEDEEERPLGVYLEAESTVSGLEGAEGSKERGHRAIEEAASDASDGLEFVSSSGGSGGTLGGGDEEDRRERYMDEIRRAIERAVTYPPLARKRRITGTVVAVFYINDEGMPVDIKVLRGSGHGVLDNETVKIIRRASPL
jgi:protein TonB